MGSKAEKAAKRGREAPNPLYRGMLSTHLRASVDGFCYQCMGGQMDDRATKQAITSDIRECTSKICPLHNVRPFQKLRGEK